MSFSGDGIGGDVELDVIGITVETKTMVMNDIAKWKQVYDEQDGTKQ